MTDHVVITKQILEGLLKWMEVNGCEAFQFDHETIQASLNEFGPKESPVLAWMPVGRCCFMTHPGETK